MAKRVTIRDIARRAGCSPMTVSLALRNHRDVSTATRRRIQRLAAQMGYALDPRLSELMGYLRRDKQKTGSVAIGYIDFMPGSKLDNRKVLRFRAGVSQRAKQLGYKLDAFNVPDQKLSPERLTKILDTRSITGLLLGPVYDPVPSFDLAWNRFATAAFEYSVRNLPIHRVCNHYSRSMALALRKAAELGYRRIGFVLRPGIDDRSDHAWLSSYHYYQSQLPPKERIPILFCQRGPVGPPLGKWLERWMPDVVLSMSAPVRWEIEGTGRAIPRDIGFIHLDWAPNVQGEAGIDQKVEQIGQAALDLVASKVAINDIGLPPHPMTILVEGEWVDGNTVRGV